MRGGGGPRKSKPSSKKGGGGGDGRSRGAREALADSKIAVPLAMWDFGQCDGSKCTGKKLSRLKMLVELRVTQGWMGGAFCRLWLPRSTQHVGIVLSPTGTRTVSPEDRAIVEANGVCVVDCRLFELC
jgi:pre-rRNA-processing protein TSR3